MSSRKPHKNQPAAFALAFVVAYCGVGSGFAAEPITYDPPLLIPVNKEYKCKHTFPPSDDFNETSDAPKLLYRCPPRKYPNLCRRKARAIEEVLLVFDVNAAGKPENIRVTQTSNPCFNKEAAIAVSMWRYAPSEVGGKDLDATMSFHL